MNAEGEAVVMSAVCGSEESGGAEIESESVIQESGKGGGGLGVAINAGVHE